MCVRMCMCVFSPFSRLSTPAGGHGLFFVPFRFVPSRSRTHARTTHARYTYICMYLCVCMLYVSRSRLAAAAHSRVSLSARTLRSRHRERIAGSFWIELEKQGGTRNAPRHRRSRTRRSYILGFLETLLILLPRVDFAFLSKLCHIVASMSL